MSDPFSLILLPGLDGTGVTFAPLLKELPEFVRPTIVSYPQDREMSYAELLAFVMEKLPDSPFVLLGESFASPLAVMIASARPGALRGLILCSAFSRNPFSPVPSWLARGMHPLIFRAYEPYVRFKWWRRGGGPMAAVRLAALSPHTPRVISARVRAVLRVNVMTELSTLQIPVLYMRGRRDRLIGRRNMLAMSKCLPAMRTVELDGGHCLLRSRAALAAQTIAEFISSCDPHCDGPLGQLAHSVASPAS